ncbi:MAG: NAD(P)-dependent oxidoreductase [Proteobacteria bacterium]|nr:NAD(P)-dependent oxidoreductase [Pseudomonadota bacterium]
MADIPFETVINELSGARVLLIGGAGFIGHNLAMQLRKNGVATMVLDNMMVNSLVDNAFHDKGDLVKRKLNIHFLMSRFDLLRDAGVELQNCDARNFSDMAQTFDAFKPTKVVHLAAIASAVEARKNPGLCFDLQLTTLRNALELCRLNHDQVGTLMLLSSSTVYGDFESDSVDETTRPRPRGIYANTKYMAERLVRTYNKTNGLGTCIIRPSALYGERCVSRRVSQAFIENALAGRPLLLEGGGDGRLDFTYIEDLVEGMIRALALHGGPAASDTFNLTYGNARTIAEMAAIVKEVVPSAILEERPRAVEKPVRGTLRMDKARERLGFNPSWPLERGYKQYCEWYVSEWEKVVGANA